MTGVDRLLLGQVDALAGSVAFSPGTAPETGTQDVVERRREIAGAWVYLSAVAAWAEDHGLTPPLLRNRVLVAGMNQASGCLWLMRAMAALTVHPATQWLMHRGYNPLLWAGTPSASGCAELVRWWAKDAPSLADGDGDGPPSIAGFLLGDLLQIMSPERRKANALVQTPWWVADFLLARTLVPAAAEHPTGLVRTIDPTCGTGHILLRAAEHLWEWYTTGAMAPRCGHGSPATGGVAHAPGLAARMLVDSLDGVELDPLTAAVARLRLTVYVGHLLVSSGAMPGPLRLAAIPTWVVPRIAVGDALLLGVVPASEYTLIRPDLAALEGAIPPVPAVA